jgi:uncharacterized protein
MTNAASLYRCAGSLGIGRLLDLYERNFLLVQRLLPELNLPFDHAVSKSESDLPLHLIALERGRWTSSFRLTYEFESATGEARREPDMWVKVYRDAGVAESLFCARRPPWLAAEEGDPEAGRFVSEQWDRNIMLYKWLQYLLEHGHGFSLAARPRMVAATPSP